MFTIEINGTATDVEVSFDTALTYEAEFHQDILQDLFGRQDAESSAIEFGEDSIIAIDFTKVSWSAVMKALWAAVATANPLTPGYAIWAKDAKGVNLWDVRDELLQEMRDCFFRTRPDQERAEEADGEQADE